MHIYDRCCSGTLRYFQCLLAPLPIPAQLVVCLLPFCSGPAACGHWFWPSIQRSHLLQPGMAISRCMLVCRTHNASAHRVIQSVAIASRSVTPFQVRSCSDSECSLIFTPLALRFRMFKSYLIGPGGSMLLTSSNVWRKRTKKYDVSIIARDSSYIVSEVADITKRDTHDQCTLLGPHQTGPTPMTVYDLRNVLV